VQAVTPSGSQSSLQVTVNGAAWTEVPSLYDQAPAAQVFETINLPSGAAEVQFGDGVEGATLPTGQNNIIANYRVGIGRAGNVAVGAITTLVDRPVGVSGVNNPMAATGGQDAQSIDGIRKQRAADGADAGPRRFHYRLPELCRYLCRHRKGLRHLDSNGINRGVFLTVAGAGGAALPPGNLTLANLVSALQEYG